MIGFIYVGVWVSWRLVEIAIVPLDGGGVNLLEKRCFDVLKKQKYAFFENRFFRQFNQAGQSFFTLLRNHYELVFIPVFMNSLAVVISFAIFYRQQPEFAFYFLLWVGLFIT